METIIVKRRELVGTNPPVFGDLMTIATLDGVLVAPRMPGEPGVEVARTPDVADYDIYVTGTSSGILPTDVVNVRGEDCEVVGRVNAWQNRAGEHVGDQLAVKVVIG